MDILQQLFSKNANEVIQSILFYLDFNSLHVARTVCKKWNTIICDLVWNSKKGRAVLNRERILKWASKDPKVTAYDYHDEMFVHNSPVDAVATSFDVDERILVCGLSHVGEGGAKVIDVESRAIIAHLDHRKGSSEKRKLAVTEVVLTKNWIVTTTETRIYAWRRDNYELVKEIVIDRRQIVFISLSATESKKHLFITFNAFQDTKFTETVYRLSLTDSSAITVETIPNSCTDFILTNGVLVTCKTTNSGPRIPVGLECNLTLTTYNLEVSGTEMLKLSGEQDLNTFRSAFTLVRDCISFPYFVHTEQDVDYNPEDTIGVQTTYVSIWNLHTGELIKRLQFDLKRDGHVRGVMLKNNILVIRFKELKYNVKFYIYDINNMKSSEASDSPINVIHRGKESRGKILDAHHFRINNFSIIENIEDSFVFTDFC